MDYYALVTAFVLAYMFVLWSTKNMFNICIKLALAGLVLWGAFNVLTSLGYVVKVSSG